ncbi:MULTISPECIES: hypothetical protein [Moorena]|uniref:Uncharacterized protein n=1 Tax=Moorena bouillonii PNG TaxID=568701 RepID=A0A1U7MXR9_9CYAN|nr:MULTISPECIES: hypothetical protein [Moorena]NEP27676.1 hypothetical protein [Moorena sp. SIO3I6]OLT58431.1 hypothetical protein BJP37_04595 [Moorena bouillonii PNG]
MTRQFTPEEIPAIKIGAAIAYIIVLFFSIWFIESTVCGIRETKDKLSLLFGLFAVSAIVPWLYTLVIKGNLRQMEPRASLERKRKDQTVAYLVENLETLLSQTPQAREVQDLLKELRRQVHNLATSQERAEARDKAVKWVKKKWLNNRWKSSKIVREAARIALENFNRFPELSKKQKQKIIDGVKQDINECIKWLITSLRFGREQNTDGLKRSFIIKSSVRPYVVALEYIRDRKLSEYCKNDLEGEEVRKYIDFLIDGL